MLCIADTTDKRISGSAERGEKKHTCPRFELIDFPALAPWMRDSCLLRARLVSVPCTLLGYGCLFLWPFQAMYRQRELQIIAIECYLNT